MASASSSSTLCPLRHQQNSLFPKHLSLSHVIPFRPCNQQVPLRIRASSSIALDPVSSITSEDDLKDDLFACPICYEPLIRKGPSGFNLPAIYGSVFKCSKCNKTYTSKNTYLDLTVTAGTKVYSPTKGWCSG